MGNLLKMKRLEKHQDEGKKKKKKHLKQDVIEVPIQSDPSLLALSIKLGYTIIRWDPVDSAVAAHQRRI